MADKHLSHYKILDELGRGGMGIVYKAEDTRLDRTVAIKVLSRHLDSDSEAKKRFIHEAKTASSLDHPNVGYIHEIGETEDGDLFIAMAYYRGEPIDTKIRRGPLPIEDAVDFAIQTAEGLNRAHETGIMHRDVKPANLMVTDDGVVKILDFGVAKMATQTQLTKTGASIGTTLYMSPEQARGELADHRADVWALGVALYEMLAGVRPFNSEYEPAVVYSILNENPEFITKMRPETPIGLERVIDKALAKKVENRFQTMDEMLSALREVDGELRAGQAKTRSRGLGRAQRQWVKRIAAAFVLAVVALGVFWFMSSPDPVSIAILPLRYATPDSTQAYFVAGIHERLIGDFLKIGGWRVRGRSSVMQFRNADTPVTEIARILDVDYVFEGLIDRADGKVLISARLIDAPRDEYVWSGEFENDFGSIQILQADIAQEVAIHAGVGLTSHEREQFARAKPVNPEAQEAYFRGRYHWGRFTLDDFYEALRWFELAKEEDPDYALAYFGIADAWGGLIQMGVVPFDEARPKRQAAAERALELDSTLAEVHHMLAVTTAWGDWNWEAADIYFRNAISANPNWVDNHAYYSHYLVLVGREEEGIREAETAFDLEPTSVLVQTLTGWSYLMVGDLETAQERFEKTINVQPTNLMALDGLWDVFTVKKMYPEALEYARSLYTAMDEPSVVSAFDAGFAKGGYSSSMLEAAELLAARSDTVYSPAYDVARLFLNAGRSQKALEWLDTAVHMHDSNTPYVIQPLWDPIRNNPQFRRILKGVNLRL